MISLICLCRYMDLLVGPYPEAIDVYRKRSPIYSVDKVSVPVAILQVRTLGLPHCYVALRNVTPQPDILQTCSAALAVA